MRLAKLRQTWSLRSLITLTDERNRSSEKFSGRPCLGTAMDILRLSRKNAPEESSSCTYESLSRIIGELSFKQRTCNK